MLKQVQEDLQFFIKNAQQTQAKYYDRKRKEMEFEIGQEVMLNRKFINTDRPSKKLDHKKFGPFKIIAKVGTRAYKLQLPASMSKIHPVFHISLLEEYQRSKTEGNLPADPIII